MRPYRLITVIVLLIAACLVTAEYLSRWIGEPWAALAGLALVAYGATWYGGSRWS